MANKKFFYGWVIVFVLMGMFAMSSGSRFTFGIVLKTLTEQFQWERSALSAVVSLSLILVSAFQIIGGWLTDRVGARATLTFGFIVSLSVMGSMSYVTELWQVYVLYGFFGAIGFALASPVAASALVNRWFYARNRGTALALATSGVAIGQLAISPIAQYLLISGGWQLTYRALATFMALVMLPLILVLLRNTPAENANAFTAQTTKRMIDGQTTSLRQALRDMTFWQLLMGVFSCGFTMSFASVHFAAYVSDMQLDAMDHTIAGEALGLSGAFSILGAVLMGKWSDRIGSRIPLGVTYTLRSLSFLVLLAFPNSHTMLFLFAVILGLSWTATTPLSAAVTADAWGRPSSGFLFGVIFTFMTVGSAVGSYLAGLDYDLMHSYTFAIIANATVAGLGALASFAIREHPATQGEAQPVAVSPITSSSIGR